MLLLGRRAAPEPCPESDALRTVGEEGAPQEIPRGASAAHVAQCPSCADLQRCLHAFDDPMPIEQQTEWEKTERRLDSWLERFLESRVAVDQPGIRGKESRSRRWWKKPASWRGTLGSGFRHGRSRGDRILRSRTALRSPVWTVSFRSDISRKAGARTCGDHRSHANARGTTGTRTSIRSGSTESTAVRGGTAIASRATGRTRPSPVSRPRHAKAHGQPKRRSPRNRSRATPSRQWLPLRWNPCKT